MKLIKVTMMIATLLTAGSAMARGEGPMKNLDEYNGASIKCAEVGREKDGRNLAVVSDQRQPNADSSGTSERSIGGQ